MAVPYTFATATSSIPLSQLDTNFATTITLGNTAIQLGNTVTTLNNMTLSNVTITSGTANVTANVTFTNANAVVYTNTSNVAITSTAITFDGTNLGVGTTTPGSLGAGYSTVSVNGSTGGVLDLRSAGTSEFRFYSTGSENLIYGINAVPITFAANSSEVMRITSNGRVGIQTASPATTLDVGGTARVSGDLTLSGGTANGVAYLNGSKVVTTGSALVFDGTNLGIGTSSPAYKLDVVGAINASAASPTGFNHALRTTGVTTGRSQIYLNNTSGDLVLGIEGSTAGASYAGTAAYSAFAATTGANPFYVITNSAIRATFDSSGNLGLGVTPSAWGTSEFKAIQIGNGASVYGRVQSGDQDKAGLSSNAYNNGSNWLYIATDSAANYTQIGGGHYWYTAPSGTAGNAITFTQAMTLDASGNLLVGTTSASTGNVNGTIAFGGADAGIIYLQRQTGTDQMRFYTGGNRLGYVNTASSILTIGTANYPLVFATNDTERARITSGGDVGIGTTSPTAKLHIKGGNTNNLKVDNDGSQYTEVDWLNNGTIKAVAYWDNTATQFLISAQAASSSLAFGAAGSERARITSDGALLVGVTSATGFGEKLYVSGSNAGYIDRVYNTNAAPLGSYYYYSSAAPNGTGNEFISCDDTAGNRFAVRSNGGIANYSGNNVNLSDRREKTNFAPAKSYLDTICAIPVQTFNYIDQSEDDPGLTLGVVAQDVQAVAPELVMESNWAKENDDPKMRLSIYQTDLQYAMMKCIQELKAQNDELRARVAALEAK